MRGMRAGISTALGVVLCQVALLRFTVASASPSLAVPPVGDQLDSAIAANLQALLRQGREAEQVRQERSPIVEVVKK